MITPCSPASIMLVGQQEVSHKSEEYTCVSLQEPSRSRWHNVKIYNPKVVLAVECVPSWPLTSMRQNSFPELMARSEHAGRLLILPLQSLLSTKLASGAVYFRCPLNPHMLAW